MTKINNQKSNLFNLVRIGLTLCIHIFGVHEGFSQISLTDYQHFQRDSAYAFDMAAEAFTDNNLLYREKINQIKKSLKVLNGISHLSNDSIFWDMYLDLYTTLGSLELSQNPDTADYYLKKCLDLNDQRFGIPNYIYRMAITKLAILEKQKGNMIRFAEMMQDAFYVAEAYCDSLDIYRCYSYSNMASLYRGLGEYEKAHLFYLKAFQIAKSLFEIFMQKEDPEKNQLLLRYTHSTYQPAKMRNYSFANIPYTYASHCYNLAWYYANTRYYNNANYLLTETDRVVFECNLPTHLRKLIFKRTAIFRTVQLHNQMEYDSSISKTMSLIKDHNLQPNEKVSALLLLADLYRHQEDYNLALSACKEILEYVSMHEVNISPYTYEIYLGTAYAYANLQQIDSAYHYLNEALCILQTSDIDNINTESVAKFLQEKSSHEVKFLLEAIICLSHILDQHYKIAPSMKLLDRLVENTELINEICDYFVNRFEYEQSIYPFIEKVEKAYHQGILAASQLFQHSVEMKYARKALAWSDQGKGTVLKLQKGLRENQLSEDKMVTHLGLKQFYHQRDYCRHQLFLAEVKAEQDSGFIENLELEELVLSLKIDSINKKFQPESSYNVIPSLAQHKSLTREKNTTLLDYFLGEDQIIIQGFNPDGQYFVQQLDISDEVQKLVFKQQNLITKPKLENPEFIRGLKEFIAVNSKLYQLLIKPVEQKLSDKVVIVPHGVICHLNFELLLPLDSTTNNYRDLDYWGFNKEISYAYSISSVLNWRSNRKVRKDSYLGIAPSYDNIQNYQPGVHETSLVDEFSEDTRSYLGPLRFNHEEVNEVQAILGGEVYIGKEADESVFFEKSNKACILHLALHALTNDFNSQYSFLAFYPGKDEDGIVYPYDIYPLSLENELVVLSGCKTGIGDLKAGEGLISIARAFKQAGANNLVATLWEVNDRSTKDIMVSFFRNLKDGQGKVSALSNAKKTYLENVENEQFTHPYYWAGFVLFGNHDPLFTTTNFGLLFTLGLISLLIITMIGRRIYTKRRHLL